MFYSSIINELTENSRAIQKYKVADLTLGRPSWDVRHVRPPGPTLTCWSHMLTQ